MAVTSSLHAVLSAFLLFAVLVCIYAVIGVNILGTPSSYDDDGMKEHATMHYGTFTAAFVTLLGIGTGYDSWTAEVRVFQNSAICMAFHISFVILVSIVGFNIIIAVMLEGFMASIHREEEKLHIAEEVEEHNKQAGALDQLLATLANFHSPQHLISQIDILFCLWDIDDNGSLDYDEMNAGISRLGYNPIMLLSPEDWDDFTMAGTLCDKDGGLNKKQFQASMRFQLARYSQRLLATKMQASLKHQSEHAPILFCLKVHTRTNSLTQTTHTHTPKHALVTKV